jgi:hypothetical protein
VKQLTRIGAGLVEPVMFLRPQRPDDHAQFEQLLPQCSALFVYADERGRDWVRWSIPKVVAQRYGWDQGCDCCGKTEDASAGPEHAVLIDTAYDEVNWFLERVG